MIDDKINALWHEYVMGKCPHSHIEIREEKKKGYGGYFYCPKCKNKWNRYGGPWHEKANQDFITAQSSIPDYLSDDSVVLGEIAMLIVEHTIISRYKNVFQIGCSGLWNVSDESLNRAVLLAGLKRRGVEV